MVEGEVGEGVGHNLLLSPQIYVISVLIKHTVVGVFIFHCPRFGILLRFSCKI